MKRLLLSVFLVSCVIMTHAETIKKMEFVNQPVRDILMALAEATDSSIIPDDTVNGYASYYFSNTDLESALRHFLDSCNLYFTKKDGIYHVSAVLAEYDRESKLLTVKADNIQLKVIIEKISKAIGKTILHDPLPAERISVNASDIFPAEVLEILTARFKDYEVETHDSYFLIKRISRPSNPLRTGRSGADIQEEDGLYSITAGSAGFKKTISKLFALSGFEYSLLKKGDPVLENIRFEKKSFDELLGLILEQAGGGFTVRNNVYYIFDVSKNGVLRKLNSREYIKLRSIPAGMILSLIPAGLAGSSSIKIDKSGNAVILSGPQNDTAQVKKFISKLEEEYRSKMIRRIDLSFIKADELVKILPDRLKTIRIIRPDDPFSIIVEAEQDRIEDLESFIKMTDTRTRSFAVPLRFIRSADVLKNLPPSAESSEIIRTSDPNLVFFKGSADKLKQFKKSLAYIDKPVPQIRYELLVVQYQHSNSSDFSLSAEAGTAQPEASTSFMGNLGNLFNLNIDIVSAFGYQFAVSLNTKLNESKARVMADTTLNGLTGEDISFRNTNTYRYRDMEIDPDTGKELSTGVTREITSGLIININGWVSGDNMITMNVKSTVSKRGADVSSKSTNPPPTSEKIINTHVRTQSGKPVVIGGLFQQERDISFQKTPFLSDIPVLGRLFTGRVETFENTELVIYIIPRIEYPDRNRMSAEETIDRYYRIFFTEEPVWK